MRFVKYLFYSTAIIFPFGQLTSLTVSTFPEVRIHLLDVLVGLTVGVWIVLTLLTPSDTLHETPSVFKSGVFKSMLLFIGVAFSSLIVNAAMYELHQVVIGSFYLVRFAAYAGLFFVVRDLLKAKLLNRSKISFILVAVGLISAITGIIQYFLYPNLRNLKYLGWDPHLYRAFGTFLDPQFLGIILVFSSLLLLTNVVATNRKYLFHKEIRLMEFTAEIILIFALLLTYSRSSYLALVGGLLSMAVLQKRFKKKILAFVVLIAIFVFIHKHSGVAGDFFRIATVNSRVGSWRKALTIWQEKPLLGIGFNTLRYFKVQPSNSQRLDLLTHSGAGVDNSFLFVLATTGIIGLFSYLNIWRLILASSNRARNRIYPLRKELRFKKLAIGIALFIHALFNNTLFYPWVMWWMWIFYSSLGS